MVRRLLLTKFLMLFTLVMWVDTAAADETIGVVLLHGKAGTPSHMATLAGRLTAAGFLVATPEMPWSRDRAYDRALNEAHEEIDGVIADLKAQGASRIVIGGHSMGANMAMGYAATHDGPSAVLALGPGQTVESGKFPEAVGPSVERARALIGEGRGGERTRFAEIHLGKASTIEATADIYVSYFDPFGLANMPVAAGFIGVPLLWTVGTRDANMVERGPAYVVDRLPPNRLHRYAVVTADHMGTPDASVTAVLDWLGTVFPRSSATP